MDFSTLLKRLRNLEDAALGEFMERFSPLVRAFIGKRVGANDVDDATQEFFYHVLKINLFAKFGGETEEAFKAYLVKSALNFSYDWRQKTYKADAPLETFDGDNPRHWRLITGSDPVAKDFERRETTQRLNAAILSLDQQYRKVMELKLLNYSNAEIAELLKEPLGSVNTWYTRALRKLADDLKDLNIVAAGGSVIQ
ncbi:MAG: sigma-70 family RNA polymerase sigma factor [Leptospiraceae bacterium]|nr:sigma-70 family RNA polymerase sigma factor [Leptospiraceae bacterium]